MNLGKAIRDVRVKRRITQVDLAKWSNLTQGYLSLVESGKKTPSIEVLVNISGAIEVPIAALVILSCDSGEIPGFMASFQEECQSQYL